MGSNRRYADRYDKMQEERIIAAFVMKHGPLQTLHPDELELDTLPVTVYPVGHQPKVKARVETV